MSAMYHKVPPGEVGTRVVITERGGREGWVVVGAPLPPPSAKWWRSSRWPNPMAHHAYLTTLTPLSDLLDLPLLDPAKADA